MKNLDAFGNKLKKPTKEAIEAVLNPKQKEKETFLDCLDYKKVIWEPRISRYSAGGNNKKTCFYDEHENRLKSSKWERAPTPQEISSIMIASLEGKLSQNLDNIAQDILDGYGEFTCHAMQREDNQLHIYEFVTGLKWNGTFYHLPKNKWYQNKKSFDIKGLNIGPENKLTYVNKQHPDLVQYLYAREFERLPKEMKEGYREAKIYLPEMEGVWPVSCWRLGFEISIVLNYYPHASRGVRIKK